MAHRITARAAGDAPLPLERDPAVIASFLSDAAHVSGGSSPGVAFPANVAQVATIVRNATSVLPVGAQSSLTGGATPRGDVVLSTRALTHLDPLHEDTVRVGAGVPLTMMQSALGVLGRWYPPVPTFEGAFAGGTIATNASGAATFKYGSTRDWVEAITVVLADGSVLDLRRGEVQAGEDSTFEIERADGRVVRVPVPRYRMPPTVKLSAGYFAQPRMDLIDLFVGSEGTLGIVTAATLRTMRRPRRAVALVTCESDAQAIEVTAALRRAAQEGWRGRGPLDVAAIEYMDAASLTYAGAAAFSRAGLAAPEKDAVLLLVQLEVHHEDALDAFQALLETHHVEGDPVVTSSDDERGAQRLFELREAVPAGVNAAIAAAKARLGDGIEKTAGDMIVPFSRLEDSLALYRRAFAAYGVRGAIWGHASDGNLHPNVIPISVDDVVRGRRALLEIARQVVAWGGAPLAEHGVGRSALKQHMLVELYGEHGVEQMRAVKRALDPEWKLSPGVLFSRR